MNTPTKSMTRLQEKMFQTFDVFWNIADKNWLTEHGSSKNVTNSTVRTKPHFFEFEL